MASFEKEFLELDIDNVLKSSHIDPVAHFTPRSSNFSTYGRILLLCRLDETSRHFFEFNLPLFTIIYHYSNSLNYYVIVTYLVEHFFTVVFHFIYY